MVDSQRDANWGHTIDLGIDLLIQLLLTPEKNEEKASARFAALVPAAMQKIDKYLIPNPDVDLAVSASEFLCSIFTYLSSLQPAEGAIDPLIRECFNRNSVVRLLTEIVSSHIHHKVCG